jgi:ABC-type phosphate/phosphonate transport system substrate-binding protein
MDLLSRLRNKLITVILVMALPVNSILAADLIFSAPPRESKKIGLELYQPIADYLSKVLNRKVIYQYPDNWFNYQNNMKNGAYDIIFDGPHFVSWRIAHLDHQVLLKLPGSLEFLVIADANNKQLNKPKDVIGKNFCGMSPPHLSSLTFLGTFSNPVTHPRVHGIKGGMSKVFEAFNEDKCPAAVLRKNYYKNALTQQQRSNLKIIYNSKSLPNQAISVSKRLSPKEKRKIANALTKGDGAVSTQAILKRFTDYKTTTFIKTNNKEYKGYNRFLEGVLFGW